MESGNIGTKMPSERQSIENLGISFRYIVRDFIYTTVGWAASAADY